MARPKQPTITIKLTVNDKEYETTGKGKTNQDAFMDALSKFEIDGFYTKGIFKIADKAVPLNIVQMKRMFHFGGMISDAIKIMLMKRLL